MKRLPYFEENTEPLGERQRLPVFPAAESAYVIEGEGTAMIGDDRWKAGCRFDYENPEHRS